ncbi:MAG: Ig-like domain-containing protein, partial [Spirosomataceae bacterium]
MRKHLFTRLVWSVFLLLFGLVNAAQAQLSSNTVGYRITYSVTTQRYTVWVVPNYATPNANNLDLVERGATAQVSLEVPSGFNITGIFDTRGTWEKNPLKLGPAQQPLFQGQGLDPDRSYYIIGKDASETNYGTFVVGTPVELFQFTGNGCLGVVEILEKNDPFVPLADNLAALNVQPSFYSRSGQPGGGNQKPLEQFLAVSGAPANCLDAFNNSYSVQSAVAQVQPILGNDIFNGIAPVISQVNLTITTPPANGTAVVNPDGTITYTSNPNFVGVDTYQYSICDKANPTVCDIATVTVNVSAKVIVANPDTHPTAINGFVGGQVIADVRVNDSLNLAPVVNSQVTLALQGSLPTGITFNTTSGAVGVNAGTAAGTYTFIYRMCEVLNNANCDTAKVTVKVAAPAILANDDTAGPIIGKTGANNVVNVFTNDLLNGAPVNSTQATVTAINLPVGFPLSLNANGNVNVAPNTPAGTYTFDYNLCQILNPTNCDIGKVTVNVIAADILAVDDSNPTTISGLLGGTAIANVYSNDLLNGNPVVLADITGNLVTPLPSGITFNASTGAVGVNPLTPQGVYTFDYRICENLNPTNCDTAKVTVSVGLSPINAVDDIGGPVNGKTGSTNVLSVFTNDTQNGSPVIPSRFLLTRTDLSIGSPLVLNLNGTVGVLPGTPAGTYTLTYRICEILNPLNCDEALVTITVVAPKIKATDDTNPVAVNGFVGGLAIPTVYTND